MPQRTPGWRCFIFGLGALSIERMIEMAPLAKAAAQKALAIDPALSEAHSVLGLVAGSVNMIGIQQSSIFERRSPSNPFRRWFTSATRSVS